MNTLNLSTMHAFQWTLRFSFWIFLSFVNSQQWVIKKLSTFNTPCPFKLLLDKNTQHIQQEVELEGWSNKSRRVFYSILNLVGGDVCTSIPKIFHQNLSHDTTSPRPIHCIKAPMWFIKTMETKLTTEGKLHKTWMI